MEHGLLFLKPLCDNLRVSRSTFYLFYFQLIEDNPMHLNLSTSFLLCITTSSRKVHRANSLH